ncbi:MAG: GGDEF domain-containing protein [Sinobacterium sp.]|nr:GGDEF domain-containing protein [Sinobacterium sp.]
MNYAVNIIRNLWPIILLIGLISARHFFELIPSNWQDFLLLSLPITSLSLAAFLSFKFNQTRLFQAQILIIIAFSLPLISLMNQHLHYSLSIAVISFALLVLSFTKDRLLIGPHGMIRLAVLSIIAAIPMLAKLYFSPQLDELFTQTAITLPKSLSFLDAYLPRNDYLSGVIFASCAIHLIAALFNTQSAHQGKFFAFQCALLLLASTQATELTQAITLIAIAFIIVISVIWLSHDMAYRDELTALPSRRALNQLLLSLGRKYTIAMLDIDHFKKFNDTHGHDVGDEVLRMVASKIAKVSGGGKPFRYGGEEFTVVFPGKTPDQVESHLDALRQAIEDYKMTVRTKTRKKDAKNNKQSKAKRGKKKTIDSGKLSVTISIGLAQREGATKTPEQVIKASDEALYRAKKAGRNCVSK